MTNSRRKTRTNADRRAELAVRIDFHYEHLGPRQLEKVTADYSYSLMEMFQVFGVNERAVVLMHLFEDETFEPVIFPEDLRPLLKKHDTFLMTLGLKDDVWHVLYMSPPYD